jgi:hypothetical protein
MTDKEKRAEILKTIAEFQERFNLWNWRIHPHFTKKINKGDRNTLADVEVSYSYKWADMRFYLPAILNTKHIRETVVHEILHLLLSDYDWMITKTCLAYSEEVYAKVRENICEALTRIILKDEK